MTCIICNNELQPEETRSCVRCVGRVRRDLLRIADLTALLPAVVHAGYPSNTALGQPHGNDDTPLLGGTALVLSGAGTMNSVRSARQVGDKPPDRSHARDHWESDPPSVLAVLESWVRDWAEIRDEQLPSSVATVASESGYLIRLTGWAAAEHPAFDEFAEEIQRLRMTLEALTGQTNKPSKGSAECFDCHVRLVRRFRDPDRCDHERPTYERHEISLVGPHYELHFLEPATDALRRWLRRLATYEREHRCDQGGLVDTWACPACRRVYDQGEYWIAVRDAAIWAPLPIAAKECGRSVRTLRTWVAEGALTAACRLADRAVLVWWPAVQELAADRKTRNRAA